MPAPRRVARRKFRSSSRAGLHERGLHALLVGRGPCLLGRRGTIFAVMVDVRATSIPVRRMTRATDFGALDSAMVLHFVVVSGSDAARVMAAELETFIIDRMDTLAGLNDDERRVSDEAAFALVRRLEQLGCAVCAGVSQAELRFDDDPGPSRTWHTGCIAVSNVADERPTVTVRHE